MQISPKVAYTPSKRHLYLSYGVFLVMSQRAAYGVQIALGTLIHCPVVGFACERPCMRSTYNLGVKNI